MGVTFFLIMLAGLGAVSLINGFGVPNILALAFSAILLLLQLPVLSKPLGFGKNKGRDFLVRLVVVLVGLASIFIFVRMDKGNLVYQDQIKLQKAAGLVMGNKLEEAVKLYKEVEVNGNLTQASRINYGTAFRLLGKYPEAAQQYQRVLSENPSCSVCHLNLGLMQVETDDANGALYNLQLASREDPQDWVSQMYLGLVYRSRGQMRSALDSFLKADVRMPRQPQVKYLLAKCAYDMMNVEAVNGYIDDALALEQTKPVKDELDAMKKEMARFAGGN